MSATKAAAVPARPGRWSTLTATTFRLARAVLVTAVALGNLPVVGALVWWGATTDTSDEWDTLHALASPIAWIGAGWGVVLAGCALCAWWGVARPSRVGFAGSLAGLVLGAPFVVLASAAAVLTAVR